MTAPAARVIEQSAGDGWLRLDGADVEPFRIVCPDGAIEGDPELSLAMPDVLRAMEIMLVSRTFDQRATAMNRQGRFGGFAPVYGQEAALVGSAVALDPGRDWIVPQYRELPALVLHGYPLERLAAISLGKADASSVPDGARVLPLQFSLAAHLPHAVGLAWGRELLGHREVVLAYCGEGATSEGDFHEACNLAGVLKAPVVFLVQNNGWAISTPRHRQSAAANLAVRAFGYGFEGAVVDGNDLLAVHAVTRRAVHRALAGEGPSLIEARCYRLAVHNMSDDPRRYRPQSELRAAAEQDPLLRLRRYLRAQGVLDDAGDEAMARRAEERVSAAIEAAAAMPGQSPRDVFAHVYAEPTARLLEQRSAALEDVPDAGSGR